MFDMHCKHTYYWRNTSQQDNKTIESQYIYKTYCININIKSNVASFIYF